MRENISISLPEALKKEIDRIAKKEDLTRSDIIRKSLEDYLFQRRFYELREKFMANAQAQGVFTDEDVFDQVS